jgi:uncharacterized repeat protein (TIGR03803 family)
VGNSGTTTDGAYPRSGLIFDTSGNLYGTTEQGGTGMCYGGCGTVYEMVSNGRGAFTEQVIYNFQGWSQNGHDHIVDGALPWDSLIIDGSGNLYGTTQAGGFKCGCGTVFELSPSGGSWNESVLFSFSRGIGIGTTGYSPENSVYLAGTSLLGTTFSGGYRHSGVAFEITP